MKPSKARPLAVLLTLSALLLGACQSRSISNVSGGYGGYGGDYNYHGELNELAVLGVRADAEADEASITGALARRANAEPGLKRGDVVALIQSGARFPDDEMLRPLQALCSVVPLSGAPPHAEARRKGNGRVEDEESDNVNKTLRLAAAKGGANKMLVYWGVLESASDPVEATKALSWVPIAGRFVPDETQHLQMRLKAVVIDVATGHWTLLRTEPLRSSRSSSRLSREFSDLKQVLALKEETYARFTDQLKDKYAL